MSLFLIVLGVILVANGVCTLTTWPARFRWDGQEWALLGVGLALLALVATGCATADCPDYAKRELKERGRIVIWCQR
jgi:hypothetical protein